MPLRAHRALAGRPGRATVAGALALCWALLVAPAISAEDIVQLDGALTDTTGELADREADIEQTSDRVVDEDGVQVFVLFIGTTDDRTIEEYAFETASANSLGVDDALVVVALDDRTDYIWVSDGLDEITDEELDEVIGGTLEPGLRDGAFSDAAIATIEALGAAASSAAPTEGPLVPGPATAPPDPGTGGGPTEPGAGGDGGGIGLGTIIGVALVGGGAYLLFRRWRRGPAEGQDAAGPLAPTPAGTAPELSGAALERRATALLIATDERIRDAQQEVDFAEAQYGGETVEPLRAAVAAAQGELGAAFTVRQRLDDDVPEDAATRDGMLREIVERTTSAQEALDRETDRIRELRDLERDAPTALVELPGRIEAVEDRLPAARATLAALQRYAQSAWGPVAGHVEEAEKGLDGARNAVIVGSSAMGSDDRSRVAVATREALEGVTGAAALLDAIDRMATDIAEAERRIPAEMTEAERDLADARRAVTGRPVDAALDARLRDAERAVETARRAAAVTPADPVEALRLATEAHRQADELLLAARDAAEAYTQLATAAVSSIRTAAAEVDRAATYIAARRRGVGESARTRLAEAQRLVGQASTLASTEPARALDVGRRAQALAQEAYRLAQSDFDDWDQGGPGWGQRSSTGGDQTAEILGQILGGLIGGAVRGGGGGWGGSPWGSGGRRGGGGLGGLGGGLGGGWGGGGGFGSGGFGGGGGGGRGRGGRW